MVDNPTKWIIIWLPNHGYQFPTSKSTWKPNFAQIGGFLYFGGHFGFKMAAIANQRWISIRNIIIYLETKFRPNRRIVVFWWPFWIQNVCHSKSTMNINSLHHSLLGIQISPKSEDFCIWRPFCTLVTMVTAAILNFCNTSKSCLTLRWKFLQRFMKFDERNPKMFKSPFFVSMATAAKFVQPVPIFLAFLVPLDVDVFLSSFVNFGLASNLL